MFFQRPLNRITRVYSSRRNSKRAWCPFKINWLQSVQTTRTDDWVQWTQRKGGKCWKGWVTAWSGGLHTQETGVGVSFETQRHQSFPQLPELDQMSHFFLPNPTSLCLCNGYQGLGCIGQDVVRWLVTLKSTFLTILVYVKILLWLQKKLLAAIPIMATWHSAETETRFPY